MKKNEIIKGVTSHAKLFRDHLKNPNSLKLKQRFFLDDGRVKALNADCSRPLSLTKPILIFKSESLAYVTTWALTPRKIIYMRLYDWWSLRDGDVCYGDDDWCAA